MKDRFQDNHPEQNLQNEQAERQRPIQYGARKKDIKRKHLIEVLKIYGEVAGINGFIERNGAWLLAGDMQRALDEDSVGIDLRYGSKISGHTKIMSKYENDIDGREVIKFYLNPNLGPDSKESKRGEEMATDFRTRINEYLLATGIARQIS